ncbi:MAG: hypothetical protein WDZ88_04400 [Candidatus Paceibacterota bacterium]
MADKKPQQAFPLAGLIVAIVIIGGLANKFSGDSDTATSTPSGLFSRNKASKEEKPKTEEEQRKEIAKEVKKVTKETKETKEDVENYLENLDTSPYAEHIRWNSIYRARNDDPNSEYIILTVDKNAPSAIPITGWTIQSTVNKVVATVGQAVKLPFLGEVNPQENILLAPGNIVIINTGKSPNNLSFQTNTCTGFFEQHQDFRPSLKKECTLPEDFPQPEPPNHFNDTCVDYIDRLKRCTVFTSVPDSLSAECKKFIKEEINYSECVALNKDKSDFYKNHWYVYLNRSQPLYKQKREHIEIRDQNGKLVAEKTY